METVKEVKLLTRKSGKPGYKTSSHGWSNTGSAHLLARSDGSAPRAIWLNPAGGAIVEPQAGDWLIDASHWREDFNILISRIRDIRKDNDDWVATVERVAHFQEGEWDSAPPDCLAAAITEARRAARCYHCKCAHFIQR